MQVAYTPELEAAHQKALDLAPVAGQKQTQEQFLAWRAACREYRRLINEAQFFPKRT